MDGSQKLPQGILGNVSGNLLAKQDFAGLALVVAAWMRYVGGTDEQGENIDVRDPMVQVLQAAVNAAETAPEKVGALLGFDDIFPPKLAENADFRSAVLKAYQWLIDQGAAAMVSRYIST